MADKYDPPEHKIQEVIERTGGDPRKLAIAYLRSQHRARSAETAFNMMTDLQKATVGAATGDLGAAESALQSMKRRMHSHEDVASS